MYFKQPYNAESPIAYSQIVEQYPEDDRSWTGENELVFKIRLRSGKWVEFNLGRRAVAWYKDGPAGTVNDFGPPVQLSDDAADDLRVEFDSEF